MPIQRALGCLRGAQGAETRKLRFLVELAPGRPLYVRSVDEYSSNMVHTPIYLAISCAVRTIVRQPRKELEAMLLELIAGLLGREGLEHQARNVEITELLAQFGIVA